jgi:hypothetical protein
VNTLDYSYDIYLYDIIIHPQPPIYHLASHTCPRATQCANRPTHVHVVRHGLVDVFCAAPYTHHQWPRFRAPGSGAARTHVHVVRHGLV